MQLRRLCLLLTAVSLLTLTSIAVAQTTATCTFTYFTMPSPYNASFQNNGINDFGTTVGWASSATDFNPEAKGFIRQPGGSMTLYQVPGSYYTYLNRRNYYGTSVGFFLQTSNSQPQGLVVTKYLAHSALNFPGAFSTVVTGINKWNTIVGYYVAQPAGYQHGFKYANGKFTTIDYPGAVNTIVSGVNDSNVLVGQYVNVNMENPPHGFTWWNGQYQTIDSSATYVQPHDINNAGTIVIAPNILLYKSGAEKTVVVPGAYETDVYGINNVGQVAGQASFTSDNLHFTWKAFVAKCQ